MAKPKWFRFDVSILAGPGITDEETAERLVKKILTDWGFTSTGVVVHNVEEETD